jgi:pyrroline-5-carboxylate reductase
MRVTFIGGGVMGEAMLSAALDAEVLKAPDVTVCEIVPARRVALSERYGVEVTDEIGPAIADVDVVIVAVKPQELQKVGGRAVRSDTLILSILAGTTSKSLIEAFGHDRIVRVMPNTPVAVRAGMSAWYATPAVSDDQLAFTKSLLSSFGCEIHLDDEAKVDMATALSGSGPAYVFLFLESLIEGGVSVGLPRAYAEQMAVQTVLGSARYLQESGRNASDLRAAVTSPAGTTAAGLLAMEHHAFRAAVIDGVRAAHQRAKELGAS